MTDREPTNPPARVEIVVCWSCGGHGVPTSECICLKDHCQCVSRGVAPCVDCVGSGRIALPVPAPRPGFTYEPDPLHPSDEPEVWPWRTG